MNIGLSRANAKGPNTQLLIAAVQLQHSSNFACALAKQINDLTTDCASTMFSCINLYGKYTPGLFASECRDGKEGLQSSASPPVVAANTNAN
ncbi:GPI-anchored protein LLG1-like [Durio zibethinus]|uniref:GPI-anchored protein LLG1-like n=1 Tax=Durio zibethinus TaxID=66656 RepID=A0A6P5Z462_DURZI|nr:GPI-anchored protein LLG1-like [Durio zibethinus]